MKFRYTPEQLEFLKTGYRLWYIPELTEAFNVKFRLNKTEQMIRAACKNHHFKSGRKTGHPVGTLLAYTREQADFVARNYKRLDIRVLTCAFNVQFGTNKKISQIRAFTRNHGISSGRTGRFEKGHRSWNTGTKGQGLTGANSGSFKKGIVPPNRKPIGSERICAKDGYILVKVAEEDPHTGFPTRYKNKHVVVWEKKNGPVPEGHAVIFKDGNKLNCTIDNLLLVSRAELLYLNRNGYKDMADELKPSMLALAKVAVKSSKLEREQRENHV